MRNDFRLSLLELNSLVRELIERQMPDEYWVEAELSECRESRGHCYMELIQRDEHSTTPVARASAKCWASKWLMIRPYFERTTGQLLRAGMKVLLRVYPQFHEAYGFSWIVTDIDPNYTLGDQARRRMEIIRQLKEEGVFDLQRELQLPRFCLNIAVISSQTAAGYGDFCNQLADSPFAFRTQLFPATMQGEGVEQSVINALERIYESEKVKVNSEQFAAAMPSPSTTGTPEGNSSLFTLHSSLRKLTTPRHYAYIKISEGCDRHCAYCAIPLITGRHQSRPMDEILDEVRRLVSKGTKEFQVIAQDLTYYGVDIDGRQHIAELVSRMADIEGVEWIRLHYAYPAHFPWELLDVIRERKNVCKYLDIALQHISDPMLSRMRRHVTKDETYELVERMRREVPGIHLRTTLMVGFPGETDEDFRQLLEFTKWARFERMGAFAYSEQDGTWSAEHYEDDVPEEVKQSRLDKLMRVQQHISAEIEAAKIGQTLKTIIDRREGDYYVGRTEFCSPEVDPEVLIPATEQVEIGQFYDVRITDAEEFDLYGTTL